MSSTSSKISLFSVEPFTLSNNSLFSTKEYNYLNVQRCQCQESNNDIGQRSNSLFSTESFKSCGIHKSKGFANSETVDSSTDKDCVNQPLKFRRIPWQVSVKRYNFLCSNRQIVFDTSKPYSGNLCLLRFGKENLRGLRHSYLSLNGDEQDTFLISYMQLVKDHIKNITLH